MRSQAAFEAHGLPVRDRQATRGECQTIRADQDDALVVSAVGAIFEGIDFTTAIMTGANLQGADLRQCVGLSKAGKSGG